MDLIIGNYYDNIKCESFKDPETGRIRVRPLPNQGLPTKIVIECKEKTRNAHPIGTKFRTENVKVCQKTTGRIYLRAKDQMIYKL
ncbi:hypothetical protein H8K90_15115 [Winogradskyella echinorum]|uniref:Uncharacterized protein n=1 Tax=Winogradskyella echinorum TaxID=538189 RepID=A0ABR6Y4R1_9FLAO|nr:hypothetical protein [Winogradskyella echinorum]MBC3847726.1 hypothetical protein [Winogradskyella echinorum]MBC5752074.1 hypothetical protein [Winogradskyella echinorum]